MTRGEVDGEQRLREIIARLSGAHTDVTIEVQSTGTIGQLERVLQRTMSNLKMEQDELAERVAQLDNVIAQRTKSLTEEIAVREKVEEQLRASHRRYQTMVEAITDYVVTIHVDNGQPAGATHGPGCIAVTGYTAEEFHDQPYLWIEMVPEEDRPFVRSRTAETLVERNAEPFEHRIVTKKGSVRWVRHTPVLQLGEQGEVLACDSLIQDVTARKLAELHRQASEEQKALALHGGDLGTWDWDVASGHIQFNGRWARMLGYSLDELEPHVETWKQLIHPADRTHVDTALEMHWRGETPSYEAQHRLRHKSGHWVWVLAKGRVISRDRQGRPRRACGTHLDITERKKAEEQLQITQFSVDKAPEMLIWLEADAKIHYVNEAACKLLGYLSEEMLGQHVCSFCPQWPEQRYLSEPERLASDGPLNFDMSFCHKDGTVIPFEVTINELRYGRGRSYYCLSGRDIRERMRTMVALREARTRAEAATRAKTEFLATMSHEIRTPLTAILGYTDALWHFGDIEQAPPRRIEMLAAIKRNGSHLLELISDLLDLSQIEADHLELTSTPTSPLALVREVAANMVEGAQAKELALRVECDTPIPRRLDTDPRRLREILTNLVGNAIKFTDSGYVKIRLGTRHNTTETSYLSVAVEDTGKGIPAEKQPSIFEPFTHGHDRQFRQAAGTGLGLAICQRLVKAIGGEITLESRVDQGSVFTFTIPFARDSVTWTPDAKELAIDQLPDSRNNLPKVNLTGIRVLVVEDTPDTQDLLTLFLEEAGACVSVVSTGLDAVDTALNAVRTESPFHIMLMDMRIPGLSGHAATRRLRDEGIDCPIVALTAHAMKGDEESCLEAGCNAYAAKPIDLRGLFKTIERLLPATGPETGRPVSKQEQSDAARPASRPTTTDGPANSRRSESEPASGGSRQLALLPAAPYHRGANSRFRPLLKKFLARLPDTLQQLQSARKDGEFDTLFTVVHRLRGTAANFGFPHITEIANECETALRSQPTPEHLERSLDQLTALVDMAIETNHGMESD